MRRTYPLLLASLLAACGDDRAPPPEDVGDGTGGSAGTTGAGGSASGDPSFASSPDDPAIKRYAVGDVLPDELSFEGYLDASTAKTTIKLGDLHDPDGKKGIDAIYIAENNASCPFCSAEVKELKVYQEQRWQKRRIVTLQLLYQNAKGKIATPEEALAWRTASITHGLVAADPKLTFSKVGSNAMPLRVVVDAHTMKVVFRQEGGGNEAFLKAEAIAPEVP